MSHKKNCLACGREMQGQISKVFCGDACRKRYKRKGGIIPVRGLTSEKLEKIVEHEQEKEKELNKLPVPRRNPVEDYLYKRLIDVGVDVLGKQLKDGIQQGKKSNEIPLVIQSGDEIKEEGIPCNFSPEMQEFLGKISYPFKMLVWGLPGEGKSTFCMKLANEIAREYRSLYVMGEESLNAPTLKDKKNRSLSSTNSKRVDFVNRLPNTEPEWKGILFDQHDKTKLNYASVIYDSVSKLEISPSYTSQIAGLYKMKYFNDKLSHIFITHAHKDGMMYRGDGSWAHEVDVVIRCKKGIAYTEKNRFGEVGKSYKIY